MATNNSSDVREQFIANETGNDPLGGKKESGKLAQFFEPAAHKIGAAVLFVILVIAVCTYRSTNTKNGHANGGKPLFTTTAPVVVTPPNLGEWHTVLFTNTSWVNIPVPGGYAIRFKTEMSPRFRYVMDGADDIHYEASVSPGQKVYAPDEGYTNFAYRLDFPGNGTFSWHFIPLSQVGKGE